MDTFAITTPSSTSFLHSDPCKAEMLKTLVSALECIMNISATNEERQAAHRVRRFVLVGLLAHLRAQWPN